MGDELYSYIDISQSFIFGLEHLIYNGDKEELENIILIGKGLIASDSNKTIFGKYNNPIENSILEIGNGDNDSNRKNVLEVYPDRITAPMATNISNAKDLITLEYLQSKFGYGTTGNRPASPSKGFCYFNETLGKPEWWDGINWVSW